MSRLAFLSRTFLRRPASKRALAEEAEAWVARLASREITPSQIARFETWLAQDPGHLEAFDRARSLWLAVGRLDPDGGPLFVGTPRKPRRAFAMPRRAAPIAAALVLTGGAAAFAADNWDVWTSDLAAGEETLTVRLQDGSLVVLDAGAALDLAYTPAQRTIRLKRGQAWFSVSPNPARPFVVETGRVTARADGAAYAVRRRDEGDQVTVTAGEVAVAGPGDASATMIAPGLTRDYGNDRPTTRRAKDAATAWRDGRLILEGLTVRQAIAEIDRYRPGRLIVLDAPGGPVNAAFFLDDLEQGLEGLTQSQGLELTKVLPGLTLVRSRPAARG